MGGQRAVLVPPDYHARYQNMLPTDPQTIELWERMRRAAPDVAFQLMHAYEPKTGDHIVSVVVDAKDGKRVRFSEKIEDFPSEFLITQVMLVT